MIEILKPKQKRKSSPPVETFHIGSISIPVYAADQEKNGKVYPGFRFKRKLGKHSIKGQKASLEELRDLARTKVKAITSGKIPAEKDYKILSGTELEHYESLVLLEKRVGCSLVSAFDNELLPAKEALTRFPGISVVFAAQDYASRHAACRPMKVKWAAGRFLIAKREGGISKKGFDTLRRRLIYFTDKFGDRQITEITELNIQSFLNGYRKQVEEKTALRRAEKAARKGIPSTPHPDGGTQKTTIKEYADKTYDNQREDILNFISWTMDNNLIPRDSICFKKIVRRPLGPGDRETCSPGDLKTLIDHCDIRDELLVSLGAHAGLRSAELERFRLRFVDMKHRVIDLPPFFHRARVTKVAVGRRVPIQPTLYRRLKKLIKQGFPPDDLVCPVICWSGHLAELKARAEVELPPNALRHGYASHRFQLTQNESITAWEMGTSVKRLKNNYISPQFDHVSNAWFRV